jgi:hypothetical protein
VVVTVVQKVRLRVAVVVVQQDLVVQAATVEQPTSLVAVEEVAVAVVQP